MKNEPTAYVAPGVFCSTNGEHVPKCHTRIHESEKRSNRDHVSKRHTRAVKNENRTHRDYVPKCHTRALENEKTNPRPREGEAPAEPNSTCAFPNSGCGSRHQA